MSTSNDVQVVWSLKRIFMHWSEVDIDFSPVLVQKNPLTGNCAAGFASPHQVIKPKGCARLVRKLHSSSKWCILRYSQLSTTKSDWMRLGLGWSYFLPTTDSNPMTRGRTSTIHLIENIHYHNKVMLGFCTCQTTTIRTINRLPLLLNIFMYLPFCSN